MKRVDIRRLFEAVQALPLKPSMDRLVAKKVSELDVENSPVSIRDIIVRPVLERFGEVKKNPQDSLDSITRLKAHIQMLFNIANEDHRAMHYESIEGNSFRMRKGEENSVTRLSTPEFSFYTNQPLTMDEFIQIHEDLLQSPSFELDPNVHVLLSSFAVRDKPVRDKPDMIFNMSLFIEGGNPKAIHVFSKNAASPADVHYGNLADLFTQQHVVTGSNVAGTAPTVEFIESELGRIINTSSVFEIKTEGGARYTQGVDVCIDHVLKHSAGQMARKVLGTADETRFIPEQIEQCITSNTIDPNQESIFSDRLLHVDPDKSMASSPYSLHAPLDQEKNLFPVPPSQIFPPTVKKTILSKDLQGYRIHNPPFGFGLRLEYLKERKAGHFLANLLKHIEAHNREAMKNILEQHQYPLGDIGQIAINLSLQQGLIADRIENNVKRLETDLRSRCKPTDLEAVFKDSGYVMKEKSKKIIAAHLEEIKKYIREKKDASLLDVEAWQKNLEVALEQAFEPPSESEQVFLKKLKKTISLHMDTNLSHDLSPLFSIKKRVVSKSRKTHFLDDSAMKLNQAIDSSDLEGVIQILEKGVDVNESLLNKSKPLYLASSHNDILIMACLLKVGAETDFLDPLENKAPLHVAAMKGHVEALKLLVDNEADPDVKDGQFENTPLHFAVYSDCKDAVEILLQIGKANPNLQNRYGRTPLHEAVKKGNVEIVHLLLEHGANPEEEDDSNETPLDLAMKKDNSEMVKALLSKTDPHRIPILLAFADQEEISESITALLREHLPKPTPLDGLSLFSHPGESSSSPPADEPSPKKER